MDHSRFQKLLSDLGRLGPTQKQQALDPSSEILTYTIS